MDLEEVLAFTNNRLDSMREDYGNIELELAFGKNLDCSIRNTNWLESNPFVPSPHKPITLGHYDVTQREYLEALKLVLGRCIDNREISPVEASFLKSVHYPDFEEHDWNKFPPRVVPKEAVKVILGKASSNDPNLISLRSYYDTYRTSIAK